MLLRKVLLATPSGSENVGYDHMKRLIKNVLAGCKVPTLFIYLGMPAQIWNTSRPLGRSPCII